MRFFHITIHACPDQTISSKRHRFDAIDVEVLTIDPSCLTVPFVSTFDNVSSQLSALERVFLEPDGSFVLVSSKGRSDWYLDGLLTDGRTNLMSVELKGVAPWDVFEPLLKTLDWPEQDVILQEMRRGCFFSVEEFRRVFCNDNPAER